MKRLLLLLLASNLAHGDDIFPSASRPSGYDRVKTSTGVTCESSISSDTYVQTGVYSVNQDEAGVFAQVVIPFTGSRKRLDCSRLYELELKGRELEIQRLQQEIEFMKRQGFKVYGQ